MSSNYPPGVSGNEPQITGWDKNDPEYDLWNDDEEPTPTEEGDTDGPDQNSDGRSA